jgi:hypothetical protein
MASKGTTRVSRTHTAAHSWGEIPRPSEAGGSSEAKGKEIPLAAASAAGSGALRLGGVRGDGVQNAGRVNEGGASVHGYRYSQGF